jgi:exosortase
VVALVLFAYRPLFLIGIHLPERHDLERWFFAPDEKAPLLVIGVAAWLLWRRRTRLQELPDRCHGGMALALLALGSGLFVWAQLTRAADLLLPSLASNLLAFACATRGRAGCRVVLLPALVLLLAVPIPLPIRNELVWQLQLLTASGAAWVMQAAGSEIVHGGILILSTDHTFQVIEECSGLRGVEILVLVSVVIRELFAGSGPRQWLLVLVAPALGLAINVLRVVAIASSSDPQAIGAGSGDHTPQGVAVLVAGTGVLYLMGWSMAAAASRHAGDDARQHPRSDSSGPAVRWRAAAACLAVLGVISLSVKPFASAPTSSDTRIDLSRDHSGWSGEDLMPDPFFLGYLPKRQALYRRYQKERRFDRPTRVVDVFIGLEFPENPASTRLFSSKIAMPGSDWSIGEVRRSRVWMLELDARLAVASRDQERALVYTWRLRDEGVLRETSRSLLALDSGPFRRERQRAVIRLSTPLAHDGPVARDRAKQTLDRFITDFRGELAEL